MNNGRINIQRAQVDRSQVIPLFRDQFGKLFVTTDPKNAKGERVTSFKDQREFMQAMDLRHPVTGKDLYQNDALYRDSIEGILAQTDAKTIGVQTEPRQAIPTDAEMLKGLEEDAARQKMDELVERAGGNDAIAKYELARVMMQPSPEEHEALTLIDKATSVDRPYENYLKERKAKHLGPLTGTFHIGDSEEEHAKKQSAHNEEILSWLDAQELDGSADLTGGNQS